MKKKVQHKTALVQRAKKRKNCPVRKPDGCVSSEEMPTFHRASKNTRAESCSGGRNVEDESGYKAVFTEQGASASQMAATKFLQTISRISGVAGEAIGAVAAYTQVKMTDAP